MRRAKFSCIAAALTLLLIIFCQGDRKEAARMVPILIGFEGEKCLDVITDQGGIIRFDYSIINAAAAYVPEKAIGDISNAPGVKYVEMDETLPFATAPQGKPSKPPKPPKPPEPPPGQEIPWGVDRIDADLAWGTSRGAGVKVAVLDGGVDYNHPDLQDNCMPGVDLWDMDGDPMDDNGHGTMVAGVIAAVDNEEGVVGVAPEAILYPVRVGGYDRYRGKATDWATLIEGLEWCVLNGMDVINDSVWGSTYNETYESALQAVWDAGIVYIAAAGNQGAEGYYFFSGYDDLGTLVAATDLSDDVPPWSSHGHFVDLCAPGSSILTTKVGGGYGTGSGTSFAAPHVAGVAALIRANEPLLSNDEVLKRLYVTAERLTPGWWDGYQGWGLVDAEQAVNPPGEPKSELQNIEIVPPSATGEVGFYTRFAAIGTYANESQYNLTFDATWTNSNTSMAVLFWDALAKGLEIGSTTLTVSYDGKNRSLTFDVGTPSRDIIIIEEALWTYSKRPNRGTLSVTATSTEPVTLTAENYGTMIYDSVSGKYTFSKSNVTCPFTVWVSSDIGGRSYAFTTVSNPAASPAKVSVASRGGRDGQTMLLQNVPNPFNPDTWIPFRLSETEHVVIRIHDITGRLVRTLELGQKAPGAYTNKEKSAYWDGKNEAGEHVSSGVYFYSIQAGDFTATKKMLIAK